MQTPSSSSSLLRPLRQIALSLLLLLPTATQATTTIHYYQVPSCNSGTDIGEYDAPLNATASDSTCHSLAGETSTSAGVKALYINGLDDNCAVIAYTDPNCSPSAAYAGKMGTKGQCFYLADYGVISSWDSVCGDQLAAASSSLAAGSAPSTSTSGTGTLMATATAATKTTTATAHSSATMTSNASPAVAVWNGAGVFGSALGAAAVAMAMVVHAGLV